jgi:hypothetical protein
MISFQTYINDALGDANDLEEIEKNLNREDSSENLEDIRIFYETEQKKWYFISKGQEKMNREQFAAFIFSDEHPDIKEFENELVFKKYDKNKDGLWSFDEFILTKRNQKFFLTCYFLI